MEKIKTKGEKIGMDPYLDILLEARAKRIFKEGENRMAKLMEYLLANGTQEEIQEAVLDATARASMYEKYGIDDAIKNEKKEETVSV